MQRYKLFIQYMGTKYNGWQRQSNSHRTVQQVLEDAVQRVLFVHPSQAGKSLVSKQDTGSASAQFIQEQQKNIEIVGSSRTDTGVHALCTTAHIDLHRKHRITGETLPALSAENVCKAINASLFDEDVRILQAQAMTQEYHARFCAYERVYMYRIVHVQDTTFRSPFLQNRVWQYARHKQPFESFKLEEMRKAAQVLQGVHDFSSFRSITSQNEHKDPVRNLKQVQISVHKMKIPLMVQDWSMDDSDTGMTDTTMLPHQRQHVLSPMVEQEAHEIRILFRGASFLHHQVRLMTACLMRVAQGKLSASDVHDILQSKSREDTNGMAPAQGLYLLRVYDNDKMVFKS